MKNENSLFLSFDSFDSHNNDTRGFCRTYKGTKANNVSTYARHCFSYSVNGLGRYCVFCDELEFVGSTDTAGGLTHVVLSYLREKGWKLNLF